MDEEERQAVERTGFEEKRQQQQKEIEDRTAKKRSKRQKKKQKAKKGKVGDGTAATSMGRQDGADSSADDSDAGGRASQADLD